MERKGLPQEGLKLIACASMLMDHISVLWQISWLRIIGRLAFPIYCFLLVEGARHTRDPKKYALRLLICGLISEVPFDMLFRGGLSWEKQNVMFTLLLGFGMVAFLGVTETAWKKLLAVAVCAAAAELLRVDYGAAGIFIIAVFALTSNCVIRSCLLLVIGILSGGDIQFYSVLAMVPIMLYSGEKRTHNRVIQWGFYLFYPLHILALVILRGM